MAIDGSAACLHGLPYRPVGLSLFEGVGVRKVGQCQSREYHSSPHFGDRESGVWTGDEMKLGALLDGEAVIYVRSPPSAFTWRNMMA